jgi:hypothetical protein
MRVGLDPDVSSYFVSQCCWNCFFDASQEKIELDPSEENDFIELNFKVMGCLVFSVASPL